MEPRRSAPEANRVRHDCAIMADSKRCRQASVRRLREFVIDKIALLAP
jgi:hypothetical protein